MAININATLTTDEGFEVTNPWAYVDIYLIGDNWANVRYYKSKSDYQQGFQPLNINSLPSRVSTDIDNSKFWGTQLADDCTNSVIAVIEQTTGAGTCTIDKTPLNA